MGDWEECYICRRAPATTKDHAFGRQFFAGPLPAVGVITAPACQPCNQARRLDEEYFRVFLTREAAGSDAGALELWDKKVLPSLLREEWGGLLSAIRANGEDVEVATERGVVEATQHTAETDRIGRVLISILRNIHWNERKAYLGDEVLFNWQRGTRERPLLLDLAMLAAQSGWKKVGDVVWYSFWCPERDPRVSMSMLMFYRSVQILVASYVPEVLLA